MAKFRTQSEPTWLLTLSPTKWDGEERLSDGDEIEIRQIDGEERLSDGDEIEIRQIDRHVFVADRLLQLQLCHSVR